MLESSLVVCSRVYFSGLLGSCPLSIVAVLLLRMDAMVQALGCCIGTQEGTAERHTGLVTAQRHAAALSQSLSYTVVRLWKRQTGDLGR